MVIGQNATGHMSLFEVGVHRFPPAFVMRKSRKAVARGFNLSDLRGLTAPSAWSSRLLSDTVPLFLPGACKKRSYTIGCASSLSTEVYSALPALASEGDVKTMLVSSCLTSSIRTAGLGPRRVEVTRGTTNWRRAAGGGGGGMSCALAGPSANTSAVRFLSKSGDGSRVIRVRLDNAMAAVRALERTGLASAGISGRFGVAESSLVSVGEEPLETSDSSGVTEQRKF